MGKLIISKLKGEVLQNNFDCGNQSINNMIYESYFPTILQHGYAYQVMNEKEIIGYYMIKFRKVMLEKCPEEISDWKGFLDECYSVHIKYIAVQKQFQHINIGTAIMKIIVSRILELCSQIPVSLITLEALKEKYEWYAKRGFKVFNIEDMENEAPTILMYMDCILDKDAVNTYCNVV